MLSSDVVLKKDDVEIKFNEALNVKVKEGGFSKAQVTLMHWHYWKTYAIGFLLLTSMYQKVTLISYKQLYFL